MLITEIDAIPGKMLDRSRYSVLLHGFNKTFCIVEDGFGITAVRAHIRDRIMKIVVDIHDRREGPVHAYRRTFFGAYFTKMVPKFGILTSRQQHRIANARTVNSASRTARF